MAGWQAACRQALHNGMHTRELLPQAARQQGAAARTLSGASWLLKQCQSGSASSCRTPSRHAPPLRARGARGGS